MGQQIIFSSMPVTTSKSSSEPTQLQQVQLNKASCRVEKRTASMLLKPYLINSKPETILRAGFSGSASNVKLTGTKNGQLDLK